MFQFVACRVQGLGFRGLGCRFLEGLWESERNLRNPSTPYEFYWVVEA